MRFWLPPLNTAGSVQALEWQNSVLHVSNSWMRRRGFVPFVEPPLKKYGLWMLPSRCRKANYHLHSCPMDLRAGPASQDSSFHPPPLPGEPQSVLKPAFLGGVALGVLSALPLVNCCCLLWIGGGGLLAVYLLRQDYAGEIDAGLGAKAGFLAGMIGALFWQILGVADFLHHQLATNRANPAAPAKSRIFLPKRCSSRRRSFHCLRSVQSRLSCCSG